MFGALTGLGIDGEFARSAKVLEDYVRPIIEARLTDSKIDEKTDLLSLYIKHARDTKQAHMLQTSYLRDTIINCTFIYFPNSVIETNPALQVMIAGR